MKTTDNDSSDSSSSSSSGSSSVHGGMFKIFGCYYRGWTGSFIQVAPPLYDIWKWSRVSMLLPACEDLLHSTQLNSTQIY